jgi:imidazolonepropionase-like amidohydrolase
MKRDIGIGLLLLSLAAAPALARQEAGSVVITGATVIDVASGEKRADMSVVVTGNRIRAVGPASEVSGPDGARVIDGRGAFVIPGLWDMHVHAVWPGVSQAFFPALVAHGITGVRDTWGSVELGRALERQIAKGEAVGPRLVVAGNIVDGNPPVWPSQVADTEERGRALVDSLKRAGAAFIKVYSRLDPAVFLAIAEQAKRRNIEFSGHVPLGMSAATASDAGMGTMEHLYGIAEGCSSRESQILASQRELLSALARGDSSLMRPERRRETRRLMLGTQDERRCDALLDRLARNGTWMVPTLTVRRAIAMRADSTFRADPRIVYVPEQWRTGWVPPRMPAEEDIALEKQLYARVLELVGRMHARGVRLLAGTDLLNPFIFPGSSLHDELELLVAAGVPALDALRAATINPARYLKRERDLGRIAPGMLADLVVLDADPLADIGNVRRIRAVIANGRTFDRDAIARLLQQARGGS